MQVHVYINYTKAASGKRVWYLWMQFSYIRMNICSVFAIYNKPFKIGIKTEKKIIKFGIFPETIKSVDNKRKSRQINEQNIKFLQWILPSIDYLPLAVLF